ncbi:homeotic protein distal-less-like [Penaeus chinensis]|uniref:homeotic protein distal-less-like n=1 Tax=Penaeus chinensis TaxID=139456 RepID=UPI001FB62045|nr:homeotic protein distal-less-like [Penaeus chinensis]
MTSSAAAASALRKLQVRETHFPSPVLDVAAGGEDFASALSFAAGGFHFMVTLNADEETFENGGGDRRPEIRESSGPAQGAAAAPRCNINSNSLLILTGQIKIWFQNRRSKYKKLMKAAQSGSGPSTPMGAPITPGSPLGGSPLEGASPLGQPLPSSTPQSISPAPPTAQSPPSTHPYTSMAPVSAAAHGTSSSSQGPSPSGGPAPSQQQQSGSQQGQQGQSGQGHTPSSQASAVGDHLPPPLPASLPPSASSPGLAAHHWDMKPPVSAPYMYSWYAADAQHNLLT